VFNTYRCRFQLCGRVRSAWNSSANPASLRNNNLFNCTVLYRDFNAGCTGNGDGDGDPTTCTLAEMNALTDIGVVGGNVSTNPQFADVDGADNLINTMADNDWHFSTGSPAGVTAGGTQWLGSSVAVYHGQGRRRPPGFPQPLVHWCLRTGLMKSFQRTEGLNFNPSASGAVARHTEPALHPMGD